MFSANTDLLELKRRLNDSLKREQGKIKLGANNTIVLSLNNEVKIPLNREGIPLVLLGDRIQAIIRMTEDGRVSCDAEKLIGKPRAVVAAKLIRRNEHWVASPIGSAWIRWPLSPSDLMQCEKNGQIKENDWVQVEILNHPLFKEEKEESEHPFKKWKIKVLSWIGEKEDPFLPWRLELIKANLPAENPFDASEQEILNASHDFLIEEKGLTRADHGDLPWFTIDSEKTRDIDDAMSARLLDEKRYELSIAITDVDASVTISEQEEAFAQQIGASIYLPDYTMPMFPKRISEHCASLLEGKKRAAVICRVICDRQTHAIIEPPAFNLGWICVKKKWNYTEIDEQLSLLSAESAEHDPLLESLKWVWFFSQNQLFLKSKACPFLFERKEYQYVFNSSGKLLYMTPKRRLRSEKLVEAVMIFANQAFANWCVRRHISGVIYTVQKGFASQKLPQIEKELTHLGFDIGKEGLTSQSGFWQLQTFFQNYGPFSQHKSTLWNAAGAELSLKSEPHRALGVEHYATWTSPLRKYGDLLNFRTLKSAILNQPVANMPSEALLEHLSAQKRKIRQCEKAMSTRLALQWLKERFSQRLMKSIFLGAKVTQVTTKGLIVFIESLNLEALLLFSDLSKQANGPISWISEQEGWIKDASGKKSFVLNRLISVSITPAGIQKPYSLVHYLSGLEEIESSPKSPLLKDIKATKEGNQHSFRKSPREKPQFSKHRSTH